MSNAANPAEAKLPYACQECSDGRLQVFFYNAGGGPRAESGVEWSCRGRRQLVARQANSIGCVPQGDESVEDSLGDDRSRLTRQSRQ